MPKIVLRKQSDDDGGGGIHLPGFGQIERDAVVREVDDRTEWYIGAHSKVSLFVKFFIKSA